jgi:ubiquinone/menaquinone biosynthesis C-methylase UbiE
MKKLGWITIKSLRARPIRSGVTLFAVIAFSLPLFASPCEEGLLVKAHLHSDLATYVLGMEKSALQKAAAGALSVPGRIADLGAGSGISARDMALLFPDSEVIGIDLDPAMVDYANAHYHAPNLRFMVGDAEKANLPDDSLSAAFMSSTTHHLTSYGDGMFDVRHVHTAIRSAHRQIKLGGLFILRDFLVPNGPEQVVLEIPVADGTAALFEKFAQDFRSSQHPRSGVAYVAVNGAQAGWARFRVALRDATEFLLRKDYRESYEAEIKEEYTFMKQDEFERAFRDAGFRVLHSAPIYNDWIIENRFVGKARLFDLSGKPLPFPATNYLIVGEKIDAKQGLRFQEVPEGITAKPQFLQVKAMRSSVSGELYDVVDRPNETIDLLPYFKRGESLYVIAKQSFPRPILTVAQHSLNGVRSDGYVVEPLSFINRSAAPLFSVIENELKNRAGIPAQNISSPGKTYQFYTSPGLVTERTSSIAIPVREQKISASRPDISYSGFASSGTVRPFEATQVLRSAQVGAVLDSRLEIAVYNLLLDHSATVGPWIGKQITLTDRPAARIAIAHAAEVLHPAERKRAFVPAELSSFGSFLEVHSSTFNEVDSRGETIAAARREYILPKNHSGSVLSAIPVFKSGSIIYVGLEARQLPAVQLHEGAADIMTTPAWRMPMSIQNLDEAASFVREKFARDFGVTVQHAHSLGGAYHPSAGVTPEIVYPMLMEVVPSKASPLVWVRLEDLVANRGAIKDGHLFVLALRAAHALGLIK